MTPTECCLVSAHLHLALCLGFIACVFRPSSSSLPTFLHSCSPFFPDSLPSANILNCLPFVFLQSLYKLCFPSMSSELLLNIVLFHWFTFGFCPTRFWFILAYKANLHFYTNRINKLNASFCIKNKIVTG